MDSDLKPCPFCGSDYVQLALELDRDPDDIVVFVRCNACGGRIAGNWLEMRVERGVPHPENVVAEIEQCAERSVEDWNERKPDDRPPQN